MSARFRQVAAHFWACTHDRPLRIVLLCVSILCIVSMMFVDRPLALMLKADMPPDLFRFFKSITNVGLGIVWFVVFGLALLVCWLAARSAQTTEAHAKWKARCEPWLYALAVQTLSGIFVQLLKFAFGRYRPKLLFNDQIYGFAPFTGNNSFPSGHSQAIWAAAMAMWFIAPRGRVVWVVAALLISSSRVLTTVHFLSDVVMGSTLGILFAFWIKKMFEESDARGQVEWE